MTKKVLGYVFIVIAVILSLPGLLMARTALSQLLLIFSDKLGPEQIGFILGTVTSFIVYAIIVGVLWYFGLRWVRKKKEVITSDIDN